MRNAECGMQNAELNDIMKIGIIVAMDKELRLLLDAVEDCSSASVNGYTFYTGTMAGRKVVAMKCGIGKVNAAIGALTMIENFHPQIVINSGVAGGTGQGAGILDLVIASEIAYHDVWCGPGTQWGAAAECPAAFACPIDAGEMAKALGAKAGLIASGDIFVSREEDVKRILDLYPGTIAVDMESAAIAHTCHIKGTPMICLRIVSDTPGQADNIAQYDNFWTDAPAHAFEAVSRLVSRL